MDIGVLLNDNNRIETDFADEPLFWRRLDVLRVARGGWTGVARGGWTGVARGGWTGVARGGWTGVARGGWTGVARGGWTGVAGQGLLSIPWSSFHPINKF